MSFRIYILRNRRWVHTYTFGPALTVPPEAEDLVGFKLIIFSTQETAEYLRLLENATPEDVTRRLKEEASQLGRVLGFHESEIPLLVDLKRRRPHRLVPGEFVHLRSRSFLERHLTQVNMYLANEDLDELMFLPIRFEITPRWILVSGECPALEYAGVVKAMSEHLAEDISQRGIIESTFLAMIRHSLGTERICGNLQRRLAHWVQDRPTRDIVDAASTRIALNSLYRSVISYLVSHKAALKSLQWSRASMHPAVAGALQRAVDDVQDAEQLIESLIDRVAEMYAFNVAYEEHKISRRIGTLTVLATLLLPLTLLFSFWGMNFNFFGGRAGEQVLPASLGPEEALILSLLLSILVVLCVVAAFTRRSAREHVRFLDRLSTARETRPQTSSEFAMERQRMQANAIKQ